MRLKNKSLIVVLVGVSVAGFSSLASAAPDTEPTPPNPTKISEHRIEALQKCTDGIKFSSDRYVACMEKEGETP